jgi:hypothetical protein
LQVGEFEKVGIMRRGVEGIRGSVCTIEKVEKWEKDRKARMEEWSKKRLTPVECVTLLA